jgi:hypothetical protein
VSLKIKFGAKRRKKTFYTTPQILFSAHRQEKNDATAKIYFRKVVLTETLTGKNFV